MLERLNPPRSETSMPEQVMVRHHPDRVEQLDSQETWRGTRERRMGGRVPIWSSSNNMPLNVEKIRS